MRQLKKGKWAGLPWVGCPYCSHGVTGADGEERIEAHIIGKHATELRTDEAEAMGATPKPKADTTGADAEGAK